MLKVFGVGLGTPVLLYLLYMFIPEGKSIKSYGEVSPEQLKNSFELLKKSNHRFDLQVKIVNALYHKLHGQPLDERINLKLVRMGESIKIIYPGYGHISFYPNDTIYMVDTLSTTGLLAHEVGHMTYQSFGQHLHDNFVKSGQYNIFSVEAAGVDEGPSVFSQFEYAAVAANYDPELSSHIFESLRVVLANAAYYQDFYGVPMKTIFRLIYQYGDAKQVKAKLFELSCLKNYRKYVEEFKIELTPEQFVQRNFQFYSHYLRDGQSAKVMLPLVQFGIDTTFYRPKWLKQIWEDLSSENKLNTLKNHLNGIYQEEMKFYLNNLRYYQRTKRGLVPYALSVPQQKFKNERELQNIFKNLSEKQILELVEKYHIQKLNTRFERAIKESIAEIDRPSVKPR